MLTAQIIQDNHSPCFTYLRGDLTASATGCRVPHEAEKHDLVLVSQPDQLAEAVRRQAAIIIVQAKLSPLVADQDSTACFFAVPGIPLAMAIVLKYFDQKSARFTQWGKSHPTALVHPEAMVAEDATLGPYCVIGARASIGAGCLIGSHAVIENDARIGAGTILHSHVFVGAGCEVGEGCEVHPHTTIGSDGFGYARDAGQHRKIPHLGVVKIGDRVEIGGNCAIDRATLTATYIRSGAKLDNICHIAHNCDLGENGLYTAGFMTAGSATIGRDFVTGGNSVIGPHLTVTDGVALAARSTVHNHVTKPGQYGGYPLQPLRESRKTLVAMGQLNDMRKELNELCKHAQAARPAESALDTPVLHTCADAPPAANSPDVSLDSASKAK